MAEASAAWGTTVTMVSHATAASSMRSDIRCASYGSARFGDEVNGADGFRLA